jgi:hypothetical protein
MNWSYRYHCAIRQVKKDAESIVKQRVAEALINDRSRSFGLKLRELEVAKLG